VTCTTLQVCVTYQMCDIWLLHLHYTNIFFAHK